MKLSTVLIIYFYYSTMSCDSARILGVFNHPGASHTFLGKVLLQNLAKNGHEVVMVSSFPLDKPMKNYRDIPLPELLDDLKMKEMMYFNKDKTEEYAENQNMTARHTDLTFSNAEVQELLNSNEHFDVIIMDWFFNEATLMFSEIFKAPVILMSSFGNNALITPFVGHNLPSSYVPGAGILMHDDMSFKHRTIMAVLNFLVPIFHPRRLRTHDKILKHHFKNPPSVEELKKNVALVLSNSHFSFETSRPYTPNLIPVGGFHVQEPDPKKMGADLKEFLDSADEGVVFFSLGSQIKSSNLSKESLGHVVRAFGKIPQKVLWKYEDEDLGELPRNVKILKWIPQLEVLSHPNVKLFITHGGILSMIESIHFQVPFICMPFNGDQFTNAAFIESRQIGLQISLDNVNEKNFHEMVVEVTTNQKYLQNAALYSSLLREQPVKPLDLATFWVEHVIKHKGAPHLKPFSLNLPWYKYYLVDVIGFLGLIGFGIFKAFSFGVMPLLRSGYGMLQGYLKEKQQ